MFRYTLTDAMVSNRLHKTHEMTDIGRKHSQWLLWFCSPFRHIKGEFGVRRQDMVIVQVSRPGGDD